MEISESKFNNATGLTTFERLKRSLHDISHEQWTIFFE